jgi:hypothetical protein
VGRAVAPSPLSARPAAPIRHRLRERDSERGAPQQRPRPQLPAAARHSTAGAPARPRLLSRGEPVPAGTSIPFARLLAGIGCAALAAAMLVALVLRQRERFAT